MSWCVQYVDRLDCGWAGVGGSAGPQYQTRWLGVFEVFAKIFGHSEASAKIPERLVKAERVSREDEQVLRVSVLRLPRPGTEHPVQVLLLKGERGKELLSECPVFPVEDEGPTAAGPL